jgi:predicted dehydrogenase
MARLRMAQYGTGHGHAAGKLLAMRASPEVDFAGVYEPDAGRRATAAASGSVYDGVRWFASEAELLGDAGIDAVASEGRNDESLAQTAALVGAGKHVWYDKPAGDDYPAWQATMAAAQARGLHVQMGYMFRYHDGFRRIADWVQDGTLGEVFAVRAHMSTSISVAAREIIAVHRGGIFYDLAGHMLDQIVWLLGRPDRVAAFLRRDAEPVANFADNTLGVLGFPRALATIDIAAMETPPAARRFEVYGSRGSAIMEPFEPTGPIRLCRADAPVQTVATPAPTRQALYGRELHAFVATVQGRQKPDRPPAHDLLVQETLLRLTGRIGADATQAP